MILFFIKLIIPTFLISTPVITILLLCNVVNICKNNKTSIKESDIENEMVDDFVPEIEKINILINNCVRFLNKKIDFLSCAPEDEEISEEKFDEIVQNFNLMVVNNLIIALIYNDGFFEEIHPDMEKIAVHILQTDLQTDEPDLKVLIKMARAKVKNDLEFTKTLHKNDKKPKKF